MAEVTGLTAAKMQEIADASVTTGAVNDSGHLILTTSGGDTVDAGDVIGPTGPTGATGPAGPASSNATATVVMFAGSLAPTGWLLCDGSAVSRTTYSDLFTEIGTTYGTGNGTTTFNIPDMSSRYPRQDAANLGAVGGSTTHEHHIEGGTPAAAAHILVQTGVAPNIFMETITGIGDYTNNRQGGVTSTATSTNAESAGAKVTGVTSSNDASTIPPYLNLNFIIKT